MERMQSDASLDECKGSVYCFVMLHEDKLFLVRIYFFAIASEFFFMDLPIGQVRTVD